MNSPVISQRVAAPGSSPGDVLSPTQVRTFMDCQVRWQFKYLLGLPDPPTGNLALGRAVHEAIAENFRQKIETQEDLPTTGVMALYRQAWGEEKQWTIFRDDEDPGEMGRLGERLVQKYMDEAAPLIQPAAVEFPVEGEIAGVRVQGIVDLIDTQGRIIDLKTKSKRPAGVSPDEAFQMATYWRLIPGAGGAARIDTLVKTRTVQFVQRSYELGAPDVRALETIYPLAQNSMRSGRYMPNRFSMLCSRRHCAYWRHCECEFGGTVEEV